MKPAESFLSQPIRDLQTMLRVLFKDKNLPKPLIPDGIYGESTMQAVAMFQKAHGLPPTGAADQITWQEILKAYVPARIGLVPAQPLHILMGANETIDPEKRHPNVYLVQAMLEVLSQKFDCIKSPGFSGSLDVKTQASIKSFQALCRLEKSGILDKITWKYLALQYPLAASLTVGSSKNRAN